MRFHSFPPYLPPASSCQNYKTSTPESPNICNLDSDSCLCVSFCKHCSQSAASVSATAASTVSALTFSDGNDVGELNFQGHTETDSRNMSKFLRLQETLANNLQSKHWQTCNTSVLHLGWSSMCFTALVGLVDSQMLQTVLCFFLLPGCSSASQTSQLQARSGKHHDSCKRPKWFCEGTFICNGWDCQIKWHPFPRLPFPMSNLNQLGAFSENWFCYDNGSAGKHKSTTPGSL